MAASAPSPSKSLSVKIILAQRVTCVLRYLSMKAKKSNKSKSSDSKQLIHMRVERSILREIDRYAKSTKVTRSVVARDIFKAWVGKSGKTDKKAKPDA
jgi:hypothetical protein